MVAVWGGETTGVIESPAISVGVGASAISVGQSVAVAVGSGMTSTWTVGEGVSARAASRVASTRTMPGAEGRPLMAISSGISTIRIAISGPTDGIQYGKRGRRRGGGGGDSEKSLEKGEGPSGPRFERTVVNHPLRESLDDRRNGVWASRKPSARVPKTRRSVLTSKRCKPECSSNDRTMIGERPPVSGERSPRELVRIRASIGDCIRKTGSVDQFVYGKRANWSTHRGECTSNG